MKEKMAMAIGLSIVTLVLVSLVAYVVVVGAVGFGEFGLVAITVVMTVFAVYIMWDRARNVSKGLPSRDERLKNINYKAGYYGFIAALWSAVFGTPLAALFLGRELEGDLVMAFVVVAGGFVFLVSYLYMLRKGS